MHTEDGCLHWPASAVSRITCTSFNRTAWRGTAGAPQTCTAEVQCMTTGKAGRYRTKTSTTAQYTLYRTTPVTYMYNLQSTAQWCKHRSHTQAAATHNTQVGSIGSSRKYLILDLQAPVVEPREQQTTNNCTHTKCTIGSVTSKQARMSLHTRWGHNSTQLRPLLVHLCSHKHGPNCSPLTRNPWPSGKHSTTDPLS